MENPDLAAQSISPDGTSADLIDAKVACQILGIKPATLYTYVSRGLLRPIQQINRKANLYWRAEVQGLQVRSSARHGQSAAAAAAMHWGPPVLNTSITEITPLGPRYRTHLASDLVRHPGAFENVAELLWSGILPDNRHTWVTEEIDVDVDRALDGMGIRPGANLRMMRAFATTATALGGASLTEELRSGSTRYSRQLLFAFAGTCGLLGRHSRFVTPTGEQPLAWHIIQAMGFEVEESLAHSVNAALILGADHELAPATFAARIAASAGSGLHACVVAALATHRGSSLAGGCDIAEDVFRSIQSEAQFLSHLAQAEQRRERMAGFSLPLYPDGDPRAVVLIELAKRIGPKSHGAEFALRFVECVRDQLGIHPNIEAALVLLTIFGGLPERCASALWGIGRTAGWIAHILEQRLSGIELRPRGQFMTKGR